MTHRTLFGCTLLTAVILATSLTSPAVAQNAPLPPLTPDVKPTRASGMGLVVADIEKSLKFYTEVLGFKIATRLPAEGPAREYILGLTGDRAADTLVVLNAATATSKPQPGGFRVILRVPNGRKMTERIIAAGYPQAKVADGTNMVNDPDGYRIELYQPAPPAAAPATPPARP